jgi:hypothetical protein
VDYFYPPAQTQGFGQSGFYLIDAFYGSGAYTNPEASYNYNNHLANGFQLNPTVDSGMVEFMAAHPGGFVLYQNAATVNSNGLSAAQIDAQRQAAAPICAANGMDRSGWNLMAEWDQSGGGWVANGRPSYTGLSRDQAYAAFTGYYLGLSPLPTYLGETATQIGCRKIAQTDYPPNVFYAYALGVDEVLLERGLDELGDLSTGVAFTRGASRQSDKPWGIDLSTWRSFSDAATRFNSSGTLTGGWSPSYLRRLMYASYLSGAHVVQIEPVEYDLPGGGLNPFGAAVQEFGNFALVRHPDIGRTAVSLAIMIPFNSGFDTKHGLYNQQNAVWYQDIPYSTGDFMLSNFLGVAYPNSGSFGTMPCQFSGSADYDAYLAAGGDPRPCEVMPFTRWGDNLDVITDTASAAALSQYKAIMLAGDVVVTAALRSKLQAWVQQGGTLVVNSSQISSDDWSWLGITLGSTNTGNTSRWTASGTGFTEPDFSYARVTPTTASVLATTQAGDVLITSNSYGQGRVIFTAPSYLQANSRAQLLNIGTTLIDWLNAQYALATVDGPQIEYVVNQGAGTTIVGLINNSATTWNGSIAVKKMGTLLSATEYLSETAAAASDGGGVINVAAQIPPFELRVFAVQFSPSN